MKVKTWQRLQRCLVNNLLFYSYTLKPYIIMSYYIFSVFTFLLTKCTYVIFYCTHLYTIQMVCCKSHVIIHNDLNKVFNCFKNWSFISSFSSALLYSSYQTKNENEYTTRIHFWYWLGLYELQALRGDVHLPARWVIHMRYVIRN